MTSVLPEYTGIGEAQTTVNEVLQNSIDLFDQLPPLEDSIHGKQVERILPTSGLDSNYAAILFEIKNYGPHYLNLADTRLIGSFKISRKDDDGTWKNVAATEQVSIINNAAHSLFDRVELVLDGSLQVDFSTPRYAFKTYFEQILSYNKFCENHTEPLSLWAMDEADKYTTFDLKTATTYNKGFTKRKEWIDGGKEVEFHIPLLIDFFSMAKLWPNNTIIGIRLYRNPPNFVVLAASNENLFKIEITRLELQVTKCILADRIMRAHETKLLTRNFLYQYDKCKMLEFAVKQNQTLVDFQDVYTGTLPKYYLCAFTLTEAITGNATLNPFKFDHNNVVKYYSKINGVAVPNVVYETDFTSSPKKIKSAYAALYDELGIQRAAKQHYVDIDQFAGGAFIVPFSTCADGCFGRFTHPPQEGTISIHFTFKTGLTSAYTLIVFAVFDDFFELDNNRRVILSTGRPIM